MKTAGIALTALASLAVAVPMTQCPTFFGIIVARSASPIHLSSVVASDGDLWLGKNSSAFCPSVEAQECPDYSPYTSFGLNNGVLSLAVQVLGGQKIYVDWDGKIKYTTPNNPEIPWGAQQQGWTIDRDPKLAFGYLSWKNGTVFCSTSNSTPPTGPWQMYAVVEGVNFGPECLGGNLLESGNSTKALAFEYA